MINDIKEVSDLIREDAVKESVILDNSFLSMLTALLPIEPHNLQSYKDCILWWHKYRCDYDLYVAEVTIEEINAGTIRQQVKKRLDLIQGMELLTTNAAVNKFTQALVDAEVIGEESINDALLIATACLYRVDYLLTLNIKDMANDNSILGLNKVAAEFGVTPTRIVTPRQMLYNKGTL